MEDPSIPLNNFEHLKARCGSRLPQLEDVVDRSERWMGECASLINGTSFLRSNRLRVAIALLHLSIEHHQGVHVLVSQGLVGSALALLRPQFETYVRGVWFHHCASDKQIADFLKGVEPPGVGKLIGAVEKVEGFNCGTLGELKKSIYDNLCDFTHGGATQVKGRNSMDEVVSNYLPGHLIGVLEASLVLSLHAAIAIATAAEDVALSNQLLQKYEEVCSRVGSQPAAGIEG